MLEYPPFGHSGISDVKRVLVVHFSQSGQLDRVTESVTAPLLADSGIEVTLARLTPEQPFPFPWPFFQFLDTFPECVYDDPPPIEPLDLKSDTDYDLVILAYQVWFLSPSLPATAFLQSEQGKQLLKDKPVITLIACRNMWLMAQERVKQHLEKVGARLIGNIALTDACGSALSFFATPLWVLTGRKGPFCFGLIPKAGVSEEDISSAYRFGVAIAESLNKEASPNNTVLEGLGAVTINDKLIASEKVALRSFKIWGKLLRAVGKPGAFSRKAILCVYVIFLLTLILTVVPITALIKKAISPLIKQRIQKQRLYYSAPSGESRDRLPSLELENS